MHAHSGHQNKITDNRIWIKGYTQEMQRRKKNTEVANKHPKYSTSLVKEMEIEPLNTKTPSAVRGVKKKLNNIKSYRKHQLSYTNIESINHYSYLVSWRAIWQHISKL